MTTGEQAKLVNDPAAVAALRRVLFDKKEITQKESSRLIELGYVNVHEGGTWGLTAEGRTVLGREYEQFAEKARQEEATGWVHRHVANAVEHGYLTIEQGAYRITKTGLTYEGRILARSLNKQRWPEPPSLQLLPWDGVKVGEETKAHYAIFNEQKWGRLRKRLLDELSNKEKTLLGLPTPAQQKPLSDSETRLLDLIRLYCQRIQDSRAARKAQSMTGAD